MLAQFQSLYPKGSLISELVQIFQGKYIVRASVQIDGVTRATGLAAADTVEAAEDQARMRALMVLGMEKAPQATVTAAPQVPAQVQPKPASLTSGLNEPAYSPIKEREFVNSQEPAVPSFAGQSITGDNVKSDRELFANDTATASKIPTYSQELNHNFSTTNEISSEISSQFDTPSDNLGSIFGKNPDNQPLSGVTPSNVTPFTPRNHSSSEDVATPTTASKRKKKSEPVDLSDVIAKTDVELQRLGWTPEQGREYLIKTYGKRGRTLLTEDELYTFLQYLQSQPDPIAGF
ncbi:MULTISPECIES: hypothetical protein [Calothrix]|uniref:DRBM domain-containing protein n=2 Tax=Calothrix TaxID=1186 RepID=A0ABR8ACF1_9CYAN|nr:MULTISPECIES: hypothetical protein [Calothrix]MBD2197140.1 hypothetical protein [Calothrix parietina FACHB-288]MBD2225786.1 hypothetical protein [Calothrix anomala FACHB-343]